MLGRWARCSKLGASSCTVDAVRKLIWCGDNGPDCMWIWLLLLCYRVASRPIVRALATVPERERAGESERVGTLPTSGSGLYIG